VSSGYVYVLSNPSMPGLVKIGRSINGGEERAKAIYQTGVPTPFKLEFELYSTCHEHLEAIAHDRLHEHRVNQYREFFRIDVYECISALISAYLDNCTPLSRSIVSAEDMSALDDLQYLSHLTQLGVDDVYQAISHLSKGAVEDALESRQRADKERKAWLEANSDNPFGLIKRSGDEAANG
jgi:hypothetical protein